MNLSEVKNIALYKPEHNLVLSLYININASRRSHHELKSAVNHLIYEGIRSAHADKSTVLNTFNDVDKLKEFFDSERLHRDKHKGLAIFSDMNHEYFKVIYLPQEIEDRFLFAKNFLVRPLLGYLDKFPNYLVIAIDKSRARFIKVESGEAFGYEYFRDEVPSKVKEGGWYGYEEHHIERHVNDHVHQHNKKVAQHALNMSTRGDYKGLLIAGLKEEVNDFKKILHSSLKRLIVAEIDKNVIKKSTEHLNKLIFEKIDEAIAAEHLLLEEEIGNRLTRRAVVGLSEVKNELEKKSVQKFLLAENLKSVFSRCSECHFLLDEKLFCPNCKSDFSDIDLTTNDMTIKALTQDCEIHFINNHYIASNGGVGALLRF